MSSVLIQHYLAELAKLRQVGGTHRESVVREAFKDLLKGWGRTLDLTFVPEYEIESPAKERRYVDGALVYGLRLPFGYWEPKPSSKPCAPRRDESVPTCRAGVAPRQIRLERIWTPQATPSNSGGEHQG